MWGKDLTGPDYDGFGNIVDVIDAVDSVDVVDIIAEVAVGGN